MGCFVRHAFEHFQLQTVRKVGLKAWNHLDCCDSPLASYLTGGYTRRLREQFVEARTQPALPSA